jgi:hypothetical protein
VKALDLGGITINSKVLILLGANNSLGPHPWQKSDLTDLYGGGALHGSGVYLEEMGSFVIPSKIIKFLLKARKKKRKKELTLVD